ncbi:hypothetical protein WMY93_026033 [Mugilogobius chulae]|uniref:Tripartite motif-containing protein 46-like n=1 Tax=Mugilogobius chulae TaxID=88201 RepID=A0AAW0MWB7_9GOBI
MSRQDRSMAETELQAFTSIMDALTNMRSMEKELHCPVCDGIHSVCLLCAAEVLVQRGYPPPDLPPEPLSPASTPNTRSPRQARRPPPRTPDRLEHILRTVCGTYPGRRRKDTAPPMLFPCPSCRQDVELGERGLTECLRNLTLERIVQRYRHTISLGSVAIMCGFCKPPQTLEATKGCADCKANFCNECFKLYHPWGTPRAQHEHILPTNNFRPKVLTCTVHEHEKLQWYCRHCQKLLCQYCNCAASTTDTKCQQCRGDAVSGAERSGARGAVCERQASLAQALEGTRSRREEALSGQVSERRGLQESGGLVTFAQELLRETDPPCFVQAARVTHNRLVKAIENLQSFTLSADPSFKHFHLDASREVKLISSLNFIQAPLAPVIDTQKTLAYDQLFVCWRLPQDSAPAWHFSFSLDSRWGLHADRLALGKGLTYARSVPGMSLLQAADRTLTSCRHYWACSVEPGSYLVKVGVGQETKLQEWFHLPPDISSPRCDPDSGHDSGAEDAQDSPSFCFLTMGMGKILLPQGHTQSHTDSHSQGAMLSHSSSGHGSIGRVSFYDAHSLRVLWHGPLDCSVPVCPAFCFIGGGALQLQDLIANRNIEEPPPRRVTIQTRATKLIK